jgi:hypothetical protein
MNIQDAICLARDLLASPRVSTLVETGAIELSGSPEINIANMNIRISGSSASPDIEVHYVEGEVELADVEISIDYSQRNLLMVCPAELATLVDMLESVETERDKLGEMQERLDAAEEKATELRAMMFSLRHTLDIFLSPYD